MAFLRLHHVSWQADTEASQASVCSLHSLFLFISKRCNTNVKNQINDTSLNKKNILSIHQIFKIFLKLKV